MKNHHHGLVIKQYRESKGLTQIELGEQWPNEPCGESYVSKVERGEKRITDQKVLRELSHILEIPLWEFGLSEFNPFSTSELPGKGEKLFRETLEVIEELIRDTWIMRRVLPIPVTEHKVTTLLQLFESLQSQASPLNRTEGTFMRLYTQTYRLKAVMYVENHNYRKGLESFYEMKAIAEKGSDISGLCMAMMGIGTELERLGEVEDAIEALEEARDKSFNASKQVAAIIHAYLARSYASNKNEKKFLRAIDTAEAIATTLGDRYGDGTDYVYHRLGGILAEKSYGYLEIGKPEKALEIKGRIESMLAVNQNTQLYAWMPLDWARAYLRTGEIEEALKWGIEFKSRVRLLQSSHANMQIGKLIGELQSSPYANEINTAALRSD